MAIDFLIFGLLLISFVINLLALAAFWVTPGLRTTANRFTINLLIINLIGCMILAPTLFLTTTTTTKTQLTNNEQIDSTSAAAAASASTSESIELYAKPGNHQLIIRHNGQLVEEEGIIVQKNSTSTATANDEQQSQQNNELIETLYKCNSTYCQELTIDESRDTIVITEFEEQAQSADLPVTIRPFEEDALQSQQQQQKYYASANVSIRCWSIDMAAALGALAVLLVVGDTWCAVTDPLRYHSRISGVKAWIFIGLTWLMGLLFGALSAFRTLDFEADTFLTKKRHRNAYAEAYYNLYSSNGIFDMAFACVYFVVIILLPFGFVCGMYWRIFSEARENGLRMRQNGSSPLLQSALNLTQHQQQQLQQQQQHQQQEQHQNEQQHQQANGQYSNSFYQHRNSVSSQSSCGGGSASGLQMQIDQLRKSTPSPAVIRRDSAAKALLPTICDDGVSLTEQDDGQLQQLQEEELLPPENQTLSLADRNQNILLTLQTASGEIKRNYSARQLPLLATSSQDLAETDRLKGIRQVHSSPNLQKYYTADEQCQNSLSIDETTNCASAHLLGYTQLQHTQQQRQQHQAAVQRLYHSAHHNRRHSHALQIPGLHSGSSPKVCSYMSSLRHRLSNASSLFKYREESRAARISILVVFMFLVSYLPYGFLVLLQSRLPAANFNSSSQLAIFMILLGNLTSPFIFAYRNKRVRRGVKRLFGLDTHSNERSFHSQGGGSTSGRNCRSSPAFIKRNSSKVSTYSLNSCKHITPQNSLVGNDIAVNVVRPPTLRPNASCSTIINFMLTKHSNSNSNSSNNNVEQKVTKEQTTTMQPVVLVPLTTASNLVATKVTASKSSRNLFKLLFKSSQNLRRSVKSCAQGNTTNNNYSNSNGNVEPVEV